MNTQHNQNQQQPNQHNGQRPENKDNLDHRENLELEDNGGHNKKEVRDGEKDEHNTRQGQRGDNQ